MLDKNGRLFGKINIIDLLIILIVIAAAVFLGMRYFGGNDVDPGEPQKVRLTFFAPDAPSLLADKGVMGTPVIDYDNNNYLGDLVLYEAEDAYTYDYDSATGELVKLPTPKECFLTFACDGFGYVSDGGIHVNGFQYSVGGTSTIRAGQTRVQCRLAGIEILD